MPPAHPGIPTPTTARPLHPEFARAEALLADDPKPNSAQPHTSARHLAAQQPSQRLPTSDPSSGSAQQPKGPHPSGLQATHPSATGASTVKRIPTSSGSNQYVKAPSQEQQQSQAAANVFHIGEGHAAKPVEVVYSASRLVPTSRPDEQDRPEKTEGTIGGLYAQEESHFLRRKHSSNNLPDGQIASVLGRIPNMSVPPETRIKQEYFDVSKPGLIDPFLRPDTKSTAPTARADNHPASASASADILTSTLPPAPAPVRPGAKVPLPKAPQDRLFTILESARSTASSDRLASTTGTQTQALSPQHGGRVIHSPPQQRQQQQQQQQHQHQQQQQQHQQLQSIATQFASDQRPPLPRPPTSRAQPTPALSQSAPLAQTSPNFSTSYQSSYAALQAPRLPTEQHSPQLPVYTSPPTITNYDSSAVAASLNYDHLLADDKPQATIPRPYQGLQRPATAREASRKLINDSSAFTTAVFSEKVARDDSALQTRPTQPKEEPRRYVAPPPAPEPVAAFQNDTETVSQYVPVSSVPQPPPQPEKPPSVRNQVVPFGSSVSHPHTGLDDAPNLFPHRGIQIALLPQYEYEVTKQPTHDEILASLPPPEFPHRVGGGYMPVYAAEQEADLPQNRPIPRKEVFSKVVPKREYPVPSANAPTRVVPHGHSHFNLEPSFAEPERALRQPIPRTETGEIDVERLQGHPDFVTRSDIAKTQLSEHHLRAGGAHDATFTSLNPHDRKEYYDEMSRPHPRHASVKYSTILAMEEREARERKAEEKARSPKPVWNAIHDNLIDQAYGIDLNSRRHGGGVSVQNRASVIERENRTLTEKPLAPWILPAASDKSAGEASSDTRPATHYANVAPGAAVVTSPELARIIKIADELRADRYVPITPTALPGYPSSGLQSGEEWITRESMKDTPVSSSVFQYELVHGRLDEAEPTQTTFTTASPSAAELLLSGGVVLSNDAKRVLRARPNHAVPGHPSGAYDPVDNRGRKQYMGAPIGGGDEFIGVPAIDANPNLENRLSENARARNRRVAMAAKLERAIAKDPRSQTARGREILAGITGGLLRGGLGGGGGSGIDYGAVIRPDVPSHRENPHYNVYM